MKKLLFVTNRNILSTSGELRLIKNRAEALYNDKGIVTDFLVLSKKERIKNKTETIMAGGSTFTYEVSVDRPMITMSSHRAVIREIKNRLGKNDYGAVILSGFAMPSYAKRIKHNGNIPILLDIHGAAEDMLELAKTSSKLKGIIFHIFYHMDKIITRKSLPYIDGLFVVTDALREYFKVRYPVKKKCQFFIIPCATDGIRFDQEEYLIDRKKYRDKYHIDNDEIVFIYSGGVSPWQCVSETIELYKKIADGVKKKTRLLMFSHNRDTIASMAAGDVRIQIDSYSPEELMHALHAGDFAFLLRTNCLTNNVAFPNKYLEYVQSGMKIITTPYVKEIAKQVKENDLGYIYDFDDKVEALRKYIQDDDLFEDRSECINSILQHNSFSTTTKNFVEWYKSRE